METQMGSAPPQTRGQSASRSKVKSCVRTLEVVEYFMRMRAPARTIEISDALGIPNSSADEILRTLAAAGYLSYNQATKLYAPSYKLVASAHSIEQDFFGGGHIARMMHEMQEETGATVFLTQQNDCWLESVAEIHGCWSHPDSEPGYRNEMVWFERNSWRPGTNFAAAMLAQQSNVAIIQLTTRTQRLGLGPKGPTLMKNLIDRVARTRMLGYALCRRSEEVPVDSIAMPLPTPHGVASHAVGVVGDPLFQSDGDVRQVLSLMRAVIGRHSEGLRRSGIPLQ